LPTPPLRRLTVAASCHPSTFYTADADTDQTAPREIVNTMIDALTYSFVLHFCPYIGQHSLLCRKKYCSRETEGVPGWFDLGLPVLVFTAVCPLQNSHKPVYYRPPRSRLYLGDPYVLFGSNGGVLTEALGLYKTGFTLGVFGIAYSAYSLVKVRIHPWQHSLPFD
jgi:hypothetical protein